MTQKSLAEWYEETYRKKSPVTTQAVTSVPVTSPPVTPEPITTEPVKPEPVTTEPETSGLAAAESDTLEPLVSEPDAEESVDTAPALFEQLGGSAAVDAAVDIFYRKVLSDERINRFFDSVDMEKQAVKQKAFLTMAFGGPHHYTGLDMRKGHAHLVEQGLVDSHFDAVMENLSSTLAELGVADDLIAQVAAIAESTREDVLGR